MAAEGTMSDVIEPISVVEQCQILLDLRMSKIMPVSDTWGVETRRKSSNSRSEGTAS